MQAVDSPALVTGGAGFVGANLVRRLLSDGHNCHVLARPSTSLWRLPRDHPGLSVHRVDLTDLETLVPCLAHAEGGVVFHLAAAGGHPESAAGRLAMFGDTVIGTACLLEGLRQYRPARLVCTGSLFEHAISTEIHRESDATDPAGFRGMAKACATLACREFSLDTGVPAVNLRPYTVYGPWEQPGRLLPRALVSALTGQELPLVDQPSKHDYIYVEDVVDALLKAAMLDGGRGEVINIASGEETSVTELVAVVESVVGKSLQRAAAPYPASGREAPACRVDISLASHWLNWTPTTSLQSGLAQTAAWLQSHEGAPYFE